MKNKTVVSALTLIVIIIVVVTGFYSGQRNTGEPNQTSTTKSPTQGADQSASAGKIVTDDFSLDVPEGWQKTVETMGASAMVVSVQDPVSDPAAEKINFKSYFAVLYDNLGEKTIQDYAAETKQSLEENIESVVFNEEKEFVINNQPAYRIEAEITQQGVNFKVLLVLIKGQGEDIWIISFNTTQSNWEGYQEIFYATAESFTLKQ